MEAHLGVETLTVGGQWQSELIPMGGGWCAAVDHLQSAGGPARLRQPSARRFARVFGALVRHCSEWWPWAGFRQSKALGVSWVEEPTDGADIP